jgi:hypothetical protein
MMPMRRLAGWRDLLGASRIRDDRLDLVQRHLGVCADLSG